MPFDIDLVYSWVENAGTAWEAARAQRMTGYQIGEGDGSDARYRQVDELKYALRSVQSFAPWVHRIFIVTDSDTPGWLTEHPLVTVVRSDEFFADPSVLPTHNSHAVESQLHRIPGLAEHFLIGFGVVGLLIWAAWSRPRSTRPGDGNRTGASRVTRASRAARTTRANHASISPLRLQTPYS